MNLPEWVKAAEFHAWIGEQDPNWKVQLTESQKRAMKRMVDEPNTKASLKVVDGICCRLGLHINEIPEELWTSKPKTGGRNGTPPELRQTILREVKAGRPIRRVATRYGVARTTIQVWLRSAA